jgi:hypothetical protein
MDGPRAEPLRGRFASSDAAVAAAFCVLGTNVLMIRNVPLIARHVTLAARTKPTS